MKRPKYLIPKALIGTLLIFLSVFLFVAPASASNLSSMYPDACSNRVADHPGQPQYADEMRASAVSQFGSGKSWYISLWSWKASWNLIVSNNDSMPVTVRNYRSNGNTEIGIFQGQGQTIYGWNGSSWTGAENYSSNLGWALPVLGNCVPESQNLDDTYFYNSDTSLFQPVTIQFHTQTSINYTGLVNVSNVGSDVTFDISQVSPTPASYSINYGDGSSGTSLTHTYTTPGTKTVTVTFASGSEPMYAYPVIPTAPGNVHIEGLVSGNNVATTGTLFTPNGINKFEFDFTSGAGTSYIDYAVTQDSKVTYYSVGGYTITHSTVNGEDEYSIQLNYEYETTGKHKIYMRVTDGAGFVKTMTLDIVAGTTGTTTFVNDTTIENQADQLGKPVVCSAWDVACFIGQGIKSLWDAFTGVLSYLFIPTSTDINNIFSAFSSSGHGLFAVITAPLSAIQSLNSTSCTPLTLPLPYVARNLTLPCMTSWYSSAFGAMFTMYQLIASGVISYWLLVQFLEKVKGFKDPKKDSIEVLNL